MLYGNTTSEQFLSCRLSRKFDFFKAELCLVGWQDDFVVWDGEATGKGKERHLFLFENKLVLTRKKKPEQPGELPTYEFRGMIDVCSWNQKYRAFQKRENVIATLCL